MCAPVISNDVGARARCLKKVAVPCCLARGQRANVVEELPLRLRAVLPRACAEADKEESDVLCCCSGTVAAALTFLCSQLAVAMRKRRGTEYRYSNSNAPRPTAAASVHFYHMAAKPGPWAVAAAAVLLGCRDACKGYRHWLMPVIPSDCD